MSATATKRSGLAHRLYHGETAFDFIGRKRTWFALSGAFLLLGLVSLLTQGLNYGIDFKGGTSWEVKARNTSVSRARDALRPLGLGDAKIQTLGGGIVRVQFKHLASRPAQEKLRDDVSTKLGQLGKVDASQVNVNDVGPSWGKDVTRKARTALIAFFIAITIYLSARFEWKMAAAALAAVVHDILVTVGVYSVSQFEVTPGTVVAFLTILGYSLYDTVVVFDRVEENTRGLAGSGRMTYADTVNLSMNQVLMRSINTSLVAILPILSVLVIGAFIMGATTLKDFGLALLVGLLTGAYSSIFIASPILAILKEREPRYAGLRQRVASKAGMAPLTPAAAAVLAAGGSIGGATASAGAAGRAGPAGRTAPAPTAPVEGDGTGDGEAVPRPAANRPPRAVRPVPAHRKAGGRPGQRPKKKGKRR